MIKFWLAVSDGYLGIDLCLSSN